MKKFFHLVSEYRWPIYMAGHLVMSIVACGVLVWYATSADAPRPIKGYYEAARAWDADEALEAASRQLGWGVRYELPSGVPHYPGMPRPVDVRVVDREGKPVSGLAGRLFVIRPSDSRLNRDGELTEIPQQAGSYRTLVLLDEPGAWDVRIDAKQQALRFVHAARLDVPGSPTAQEGNVTVIAARETRAPSAVTVTCAHCGLAVPSSLVREGEDLQFCCNGCRQVHTLVREWGFDQYYRLVDQQRGSIEPAHVTGRSFDDFDDEALQAEATDRVGDDRRCTRLYLEGVHCAACVWLVEKLPAVLRGVDEVRLNYGSAVAEITWRPAHTKLSAIGRALDRLGYTPHVHRAARVQEARRSEDRASLARLGVATACAMNLMFLHGALYAGEYSGGMASAYEALFRWLSFVVALPVVAFSARPFFQTALAGLRAGMVHIDLPIAIALASAFAASTINTFRGTGSLWFDSLAMLVAALLGARQVQRGAQRAALERADSLRGVAFLEFARRLEGDGPDAPAVEVPLAALTAGERVEVRSGEIVPVDGLVLVGRSTVDNAVLTGESVPVAVREGDLVNAGATNLGARLVVRVDAAGQKTRVGALLALVQDALSRKPALLETTDKLAKYFVQGVLGLAVFTGLAWLTRGPEAAFEHVVALLVVACPCALGLSVPLAISVTLLRAARAGIFIKNPDALERLRHVDTVLLDKTGTLTEGRATVAAWHGEDVVLELARALEAQSSHAVARAFQGAVRRGMRVARTVDQVSETGGQGIAGRIDGHDVRVGNRAHLQRGGTDVTPDLLARADAMVADGLSPVFVAVDGKAAGVAGIGDALRPDARKTVAALRGKGIRVRILSGDHPEVVTRIGAQLGLPAADIVGGVTPEAKRDFVAALVSTAGRPGTVVMVGDGVNDAAALALADVGVAVHGGTGATIAAADIVLTRDGVEPLLAIVDGARRLRGVIRRNLGFSILYNAVASGFAVVGMVSPLLAALLMPISSLTVVLSSAFTRTFAQPHARRHQVAGAASAASGAEA